MCHENECSCGHEAHHSQRGEWEHHGGYGRGHHSGCGCGHFGHGHRRFFTKEEIIARLEEYLKELQAEAKGVEERLAELRREKP